MERKEKGKILNGLLGEPSLEKGAGAAYSLAAVLPYLLVFVFSIVVGAAGVTMDVNADWYLYVSYLLPQISLLLVAVFFFTYTGASFKAECKKTVSGRPIWYAVALALQIGLLCLTPLNGWFLSLLEKLGYQSSEIYLPSMDGFGFVGVLLVVALLPSVMEETLFRCVLLKGVNAFPKWGAALICGAMFSLFHQNPEQTAYQFVCGAAFAWLVLSAESILPSIVAHFINNAFILFAEKFGFYEKIALPLFIISCVCMVAVIVFFIVYERRKNAEPCEKTKKTEKTGSKKQFILFSLVGIAVCALGWILNFAMGF